MNRKPFLGTVFISRWDRPSSFTASRTEFIWLLRVDSETNLFFQTSSKRISRVMTVSHRSIRSSRTSKVLGDVATSEPARSSSLVDVSRVKSSNVYLITHPATKIVLVILPVFDVQVDNFEPKTCRCNRRVSGLSQGLSNLSCLARRSKGAFEWHSCRVQA
jgi:hypothetical protein